MSTFLLFPVFTPSLILNHHTQTRQKAHTLHRPSPEHLPCGGSGSNLCKSTEFSCHRKFCAIQKPSIIIIVMLLRFFAEIPDRTLLHVVGSRKSFFWRRTFTNENEWIVMTNKPRAKQGRFCGTMLLEPSPKGGGNAGGGGR